MGGSIFNMEVNSNSCGLNSGTALPQPTCWLRTFPAPLKSAIVLATLKPKNGS